MYNNDPQQQQQQQQQQHVGVPPAQDHAAAAAARADSFVTAAEPRDNSPEDFQISEDSISPKKDARPRPRQRSSSGSRPGAAGRKSPVLKPIAINKRTAST
jgi:hypothetical protein